MSFKLDIQIDSNGRKFLQDNNENIILVFSSGKESAFSIVCSCFSPFSDSNEVEFFNEYFLYGTSQEILPFNIIKFNDKLAIQPGNVYQFDGASFTYLREAYSNNVCGLLNRSVNTKNLTSGIAQRINVMNADEFLPISIGSVPQNQTIYFELTYLVKIFVAAGIFSNMIIPDDMLTPVGGLMKKIKKNVNSYLIVGDYLELDLRETKSVVFDMTINAFRK